MTRAEAAVGAIDKIWQEVKRTPFMQRQLGVPVTRLPDLSLEQAARRASVARDALGLIANVDLDALPHELALTVRVARYRAESWLRAGEWYWRVIDPLGVGRYGMFLASPYCGGHLLSFVHGVLNEFRFVESGDADRYLSLIAEYARLMRQFVERTEGQAARHIYMSRPHVVQARRLFSSYRSGLRAALSVSPERLHAIDASGRLVREIATCVSTLLEPAFDRLLDLLNGEYFHQAPEAVGMSRLPGGREIYDSLIQLHTTLDLSADQIHQTGLSRMTRLHEEMRSLAHDAGAPDVKAFEASIFKDQKWRASTREEIARRFTECVDRIRPHLPAQFATLPTSPTAVAALPASLEGGMTFGYYDAPRSDGAAGTYFYNAKNLTAQPLHIIAALTFHELVPGHHLHRASERENVDLHPLRKFNFITVYSEGWAEYAAQLAREMGMYVTREEMYGRLALDAFLSCRLVVDTGLNALGWSLDRARDYLEQHTIMSEDEIASEILRYSCDTPAQVLAYKLGDAALLSLRERMRSSLGPAGTNATFHQLVLGSGAMPLPDLIWHVERSMHASANSRYRDFL